MEESLTLTPEEEAALEENYGNYSYGYPTPEEKNNIYTYFKRVIGMFDNTKTANLTADEIGMVKIPVRTNLEIAQYCESMGMKGFANFFKKEAQILLGTSLSREGFLNKLAVTQKRESEIKTRNAQPRDSKGWFTKKKQKEANF